jgi:hypothetical protein
VVERPALTLTCECGERRAVQYGHRWTCETCGRTWNTNQIPEHDYDAVLKIQRRYRIVPMLLLTIMIATVVAFIIAGRVLAVVLLPLVLTMWFMFVRPIQRRRLKDRVAALPEWKLTPE